MTTLNDDWKASRSTVGIRRRVQSLAISAPVVDKSALEERKVMNVKIEKGGRRWRTSGREVSKENTNNRGIQ